MLMSTKFKTLNNHRITHPTTCNNSSLTEIDNSPYTILDPLAIPLKSVVDTTYPKLPEGHSSKVIEDVRKFILSKNSIQLQ